MRPQLREFNHSSTIWLRSFLFLLVFFIAQVGISLLGKVNLVRDLVDNQRSCGAKFAGLYLKPDRCVILRHNDSYHHLTEDRDPHLHYRCLDNHQLC